MTNRLLTQSWRLNSHFELLLQKLHHSQHLFVIMAVAYHLQGYWKTLRLTCALIQLSGQPVPIVIFKELLMRLDPGHWNYSRGVAKQVPDGSVLCELTNEFALLSSQST